jgi:hypothetical protein
MTGSHGWAKAGVMMKATTAAGSHNVLAAATPGNGIHMQYNLSQDVAGPTYAGGAIWLRIIRSGNVYTTASSLDGSSWATVGSATIDMPTQLTLGLFSGSHDPQVLSEATFDSVTVVGTP